VFIFKKATLKIIQFMLKVTRHTFIDYNFKEFTEISMEINRPTITNKALLPFWRVGTMAACCHVGKCCSDRLR